MKKLDYRWTALWLLWVAFFLQQGTRQVYGPALPSFMAATGTDAVSAGIVGTVFTLVYGICVPFAGLAADLVNRKLMVVAGVAIFSIGIFMSGFAASVGMLMVAYGIINGFGQTFYYPSATSILSQLHTESRATAFAILQLAMYVGIIGCGGFSGWCSGLSADGWKLPFLILGGAGLVWSVALGFMLRNTKPEVRGDGASSKPTVKEALLAVAKNPLAICITIGLIIVIYVDVGFKIWMPDYLQGEFGVSKGSAGLNAVLWHYAGAAVGVIAGSRFGDRIAARRPAIRMELGFAGLLLAAPFAYFTAHSGSFAMCCALMGALGFWRGIYDSNFMAAFVEAIDARCRASAVGVMMCAAFVFGSLSPMVLGWMKVHFTMTAGLASFGAVYLAGAAVLLFARMRFVK